MCLEPHSVCTALAHGYHQKSRLQLQKLQSLLHFIDPFSAEAENTSNNIVEKGINLLSFSLLDFVNQTNDYNLVVFCKMQTVYDMKINTNLTGA